MRTIEEIKNYFGPKFSSNYEDFNRNKKLDKWTKMIRELGDVSHLPGFHQDFKIKAESCDHYYSLIMHHPQMIPAMMKMSFPILKNIIRAMIADPRLTDEYHESRKTLNEFILFIDTQ
jgi:hypothetical protein